MDGSGVPVIGVSPAAACPTSASQFPDNRENNRESAKFPVNSALAGVNSSSNFKRLQGIPRCLRKRRILKQFQRLAGDFRKRGKTGGAGMILRFTGGRESDSLWGWSRPQSSMV
jgi:hypothetical protein